MPRLTVSISDDQETFVEKKSGDSGEYESKSSFVRECINRYEQVNELEAEVNNLRNQLQAVNRREDNIEELAEYVDGERQLQKEARERQRAPIWDRLRWFVFGRGPD